MRMRRFIHRILNIKHYCCGQSLAATKNPFEETSQLYQRAIESAKRNGFIQCQALACELFAEYWAEKGFAIVAETYIRESLYLYRRWGVWSK